ncbi:MAG: hypothetical protein KBD78_03900 [Oligoflexales bacterium]|nr:hypothetical protein [Oligoflexales bacterium]
MNLGEIVSNVRIELQTPTTIDVVIRRWANRAQHRFISEANHNFSWLAITDLTFTTTASQREYALSSLVDNSKLIILTERNSPRKIEVITREQFLENVPDPTDNQGDPYWAYHSGFTPVVSQPTSSSVLTLVSTTSDNSVVKIEGLNSSGVLVGEEITLNGTTPVNSVNSYTKILNRGISGFLLGTVTMTSNSGGVTNSVISPRSRQGMHPKIVLWPTPSGAMTYYYDAYMRLPELVNDNDFSLIPERYHDAIESYCLYRGYLTKKDPGLAEQAMNNFKDVVRQAVLDDKAPRKNIQMQSDYSTRGFSKFSNLPGNYPRG